MKNLKTQMKNLSFTSLTVAIRFHLCTTSLCPKCLITRSSMSEIVVGRRPPPLHGVRRGRLSRRTGQSCWLLPHRAGCGCLLPVARGAAAGLLGAEYVVRVGLPISH